MRTDSSRSRNREASTGFAWTDGRSSLALFLPSADASPMSDPANDAPPRGIWPNTRMQANSRKHGVREPRTQYKSLASAEGDHHVKRVEDLAENGQPSDCCFPVLRRWNSAKCFGIPIEGRSENFELSPATRLS